MKILLAEDELRLQEALSELLRAEKHEVDCTADGKSALSAVLCGNYDAVILDIMMPGMDGYEVTREIRKAGLHTPVLMLTAKSEIDDKVTGFDCGADDYMTKPFLSRELLARLRMLIRRKSSSPEVPSVYGDLRLDKAGYTLHCTDSGQSVRLGEKEYRITECLIQSRGGVVSRENLALRVWGGYGNDTNYNSVEVYMSFVRKKLAFIGSKTEIKAIRGAGYELRYTDV